MNQSKFPKISSFYLLSIILLSAPGFSLTYYVKTDGNDENPGTRWEHAFKTISRGTQVAVAGDDIRVAEGTYSEGKTLIIPGGVTVLGGFASGEITSEERDFNSHPTIIDGGESYGCVENNGLLDGFHIVRGMDDYGGGVYNNYGATVSHCKVYGNKASYGGGIFNKSGLVSSCFVYNNTGGDYGGGIYCDRWGDIENAVVYGNSTKIAGGIYINYSCKVLNCTVYGNSASDLAGGMYILGASPVTNCISWNNKNGDMYGNMNKISFSCFGEAAGSQANIRQNPFFVNTSGDISLWDFHLQDGSPCIDSGTLEDAPEKDLDGNPRPGGDSKICIGTYESPDDFLPGPGRPPVLLYVSKKGNDTDGDSWEDALTSITRALEYQSGDELCEIWVEAGIYSEKDEIFVPGRINLYGGFAGNESSRNQRNFYEYHTIVDGEKNYRCLINFGYLNGLYIMNGKPDYGDDYSQNGGGVWNQGTLDYCNIYQNYSMSGGGVYNDYGIVKNCKVYENDSLAHGGGIFNNFGEIYNCSVFNNEAVGIYDYSGGGICNYLGTIDSSGVYDNISPDGGIYNYLGTVKNSSICSNEGYYCGGINNYGGIIDGCRVFGNSAEYDSGGIYNLGTVSNCSIYGNKCLDSESRGGGVMIEYGNIINCNIWGNSSSYGGGAYNLYSGNIENCIIYINSASYGGGVYNLGSVNNCTIYSNISKIFMGGVYNGGVVRNSIVWNNKGNDILGNLDSVFHSCFGEAVEINGNIMGNPYFINTSGEHTTWDFHLQDGSPCVDSGTLDGAPEKDIEGSPRPGDDGKVCMGAYESPPEYEPSEKPPVFRRLYVGKTGDNTDGSSWEKAFHSISIALNSFTYDDHYEIFVSKGSYNEGGSIFVSGRVLLYGGFAGTEASLEERNWESNPTIIDGDGKYGCAINYGLLDGFHVTKGKGDLGAGILNYGEVSYCMVYDNSASKGGGIYNEGNVLDCRIYQNQASEEGGGIFNDHGAIRQSWIFGNSSNKSAGIANYQGSIRNCLLYNNSTFIVSLYDILCGAMENNQGEIINCTIYANSGGGINNIAGAITNCIVWKNSRWDIQGALEGVSFSCFGDATGSSDTIKCNPLFINTKGDPATWDFHLQNGSACIDSGSLSNAPETDIEGNLRPGGDGKICMGAYESPDDYEPSDPPLPVRLYVSKTGSNADGASWATAFTSISQAINPSIDDILDIWVAKGIYREGKLMIIPPRINLYGGFSGTESYLEDRDIDGNPTTIDGNESYRCMDNFSYIDGFEVRYGKDCGIWNWGIVENCIVYDNRGLYGGGIRNYGIVDKSKILGNYASAVGGGVYNTRGLVSDCIIYDNSSESGGGIRNSRGIINDCIIYDNTASYGGGVYNEGTITNSIFFDNKADYEGGGAYNLSGKMLNCSVYKNTGNGGIYNEDSIINTIAWNNYGGDILENLENIFNSCFVEASNSDGNISANPLFANTSGNSATWDFHLQNGSPCIDTGNQDNFPETDIQGNPRPGGDGKVCMGAYESPDEYIPLEPAPVVRLYVSKTGDNTDGTSWSTALLSIIMAVEKSSDDLCDIWVAEGTYKEGKTVNIFGRINIFGGFAGTEISLDERVIENHPSIIDGEEKYGCVYNTGLFDGFHVTNGNGTNGAGIYNDRGTVVNCSVYGNTFEASNPHGAEGGAGIYNNKGKVVKSSIYNNTIGGYIYGGGGIYNRYGEISDCEIYGNIHTEGWVCYGVGIYNLGITIDCNIWGNKSYYSTSYGAIFNYGDLINCNVNKNMAYYGAGVYCDYGQIVNCNIYDNLGAYAAGVYLIQGEVINSNIYGNLAWDCGIYFKEGSITNCIVWNNRYDDIIGSLENVSYTCFFESDGMRNNIRSNPLFINTSGDSLTWDFHLQNNSPCVDAGKLENAPETDIEGKPRPGADGMICMGSCESPDSYESSDPLPRIRLYVNQSGTDKNGTSWKDAFSSITLALEKAGDNFADIWVAQGIYKEKDTIYLPKRFSLYGGFEGVESDLGERIIDNHPTIIDGQGLYRCVLNSGYIEGFHITKAIIKGSGGGIYNQGKVSQCRIYGNKADQGGGICNSKGEVTLCMVYDNFSWEYGGGMMNHEGEVYNCIVFNNQTDGTAGGVYNWDGTIVNSTVYGCSDEGIYIDEGTIYNCISWKNTYKDVYNNDGYVSYSCFEKYSEDGYCSDYHNINSNPLFIKISGDASTWDFRLRDDSPCIDAGSHNENQYDACLPPGKGMLFNDMGAYGGPLNCKWGFYVGRNQIIDYLLNRISLSVHHLPQADKNQDSLIDIADYVKLSLMIPEP